MPEILPTLPESDVPAIAMLTFAFLALSVIATIIYHIIKNKDRQPSPEDELIDNISKPERRKPNQIKPEPWEKDADWWKK